MESLLAPWAQELVRWGPGGLLVALLILACAAMWRELGRQRRHSEDQSKSVTLALVDNTKALDALTSEIRRGTR